MYQTYLFQLYSPLIREELFNHPKLGHGTAHSRRVLYLALEIAEFQNLTDQEYKILALACCYHDIGRTHGEIESEHGELSARKVLSLGLLDKHRLSKEDEELVLLLIKMHSLSDNEFKGHDRELILYKILKDADALDRVRFCDLDPKYLRLPTSSNLIKTAKNLLLRIKK